MSSISEDIKQIREAIYGRDVREAIADGIEQCYTDVSGGVTKANTAANTANNAAVRAEAAAAAAEEIPGTASLEDIDDLKSSLNKNKEPLNAVWEIGNISTADGSEVSRNDCIRTPAYPINASKDLIGIFRTDVSAIGVIYINAHFYDRRMNYLGSYRPGDSQIHNHCYIDPIEYGEVSFVRFTKLFMNSSDVSTTSNTHDIYITDVTSTDSDLYAAQCKEGYEVVSFHVVRGGINIAGAVYDGDYVARSETGVYFPAGSRIAFLKGYRRYQPRIHFYYPNGRKYEGSYNDTNFITDPDGFDYSVCPDGLYAGLSFNDAHGLTLSEKNYREIENICKIIRPVKKINDSYEERLGGNVVGNQNLLQNGMPFVYDAAYWVNDGIYYKEVTEDNRNWHKDNAVLSVHLKPGEYGFICSFIANEGTGIDAVAYCIWDEDGEELVNYGARYAVNYDVERSFTISEETNIYLQLKTFPGESFKVYLYKKPAILTLRQVSNILRSEDPLYENIYRDAIDAAILKYNDTIDANKIGYIFITDLHVNSLYQDRNESLHRQLQACVEIANRTNISFIAFGGDILDRETTYEQIWTLVSKLYDGLDGCRKPVVFVVGNHDDNPYTNNVPLSKGQVRALFCDSGTMPAIYPDNQKCYYSFKIRDFKFICLDAIDYSTGYAGDTWWGYSEEQVKWLASELLQTNEKIIIFSHITLDEDHNTWNLGNNGGYTKDIRDLLEAYNNRSTIALYGVEYDFRTVTGKVLYSHSGHQHFDEQYTKVGYTIPILATSSAKNQTTYDWFELVEGNTYRALKDEEKRNNTAGWTMKAYPNRVIGTISEATFDIVSVGETQVNVIRVGAGEDRVFTPAQ